VDGSEGFGSATESDAGSSEAVSIAGNPYDWAWQVHPRSGAARWEKELNC